MSSSSLVMSSLFLRYFVKVDLYYDRIQNPQFRCSVKLSAIIHNARKTLSNGTDVSLYNGLEVDWLDEDGNIQVQHLHSKFWIRKFIKIKIYFVNEKVRSFNFFALKYHWKYTGCGITQMKYGWSQLHQYNRLCDQCANKNNLKYFSQINCFSSYALF